MNDSHIPDTLSIPGWGLPTDILWTIMTAGLILGPLGVAMRITAGLSGVSSVAARAIGVGITAVLLLLVAMRVRSGAWFEWSTDAILLDLELAGVGALAALPSYWLMRQHITRLLVGRPDHSGTLSVPSLLKLNAALETADSASCESRTTFDDVVSEFSELNEAVDLFKGEVGATSHPQPPDLASISRPRILRKLGLVVAIFGLAREFVMGWLEFPVEVPRENKWLGITVWRWVEEWTTAKRLNEQLGGEPGTEHILVFKVISVLVLIALFVCVVLFIQSFARRDTEARRLLDEYVSSIRVWAAHIERTSIRSRRRPLFPALACCIGGLVGVWLLIFFFPLGFSQPRWEIKKSLMAILSKPSEYGSGTSIDQIMRIRPDSKGGAWVELNGSTKNSSNGRNTFRGKRVKLTRP